jgi:hypothetical protein
LLFLICSTFQWISGFRFSLLLRFFCFLFEISFSIRGFPISSFSFCFLYLLVIFLR